MTDRERGRLIGIAIVLIGAIGLWWFNASREGAREEAKWAGCLGKPLAACRFPEGYAKDHLPCPKWLDCGPALPGHLISVVSSDRDRGEILNSSLYAILSSDKQGILRKVTVLRESRLAI